MEPGVLIFGLIFIAIVFRLIAGSMDTGRIEEYVRAQGWELVDRSWAPFGPGWFGEKDARIYQIVYRDNEGALHKAHVKTSLFSGVYLTDDHIVEVADTGKRKRIARRHGAAPENRDEVERLRRRIRELESREGNKDAH